MKKALTALALGVVSVSSHAGGDNGSFIAAAEEGHGHYALFSSDVVVAACGADRHMAIHDDPNDQSKKIAGCWKIQRDGIHVSWVDGKRQVFRYRDVKFLDGQID